MYKLLRPSLWAKTNRGQALVETALVIPFLMMVMVGGAELARIAYAGIEVSNAACAAVQYGAQTTGTASDQTGMLNAAQADAADLSGLTLSSSLSYICSDGSASTGLNTDCSTSHIETILTVYTKASFNTLFKFPGISGTINLYGHATQKVLGD